MFQLQIPLPKWRQRFDCNSCKNPGFLFKSSQFCIFLTIQFCSNFTSMWSKDVSNNVGRDFRLQMLAFYVTINNVYIGSLNFLYTLFDKHFDHMLVKFEQNRMNWNLQDFEVLGKKCLIIFEKVFTPFWKTFLWYKQLFDDKIWISI